MPSSSIIIGGDVRPIRRWLQINVCVLSCLSGVVFAAAEGRPWALLNVPIALIGLLLIDRRDVSGLSPLAANVLGFGAFLLAGYEFFGEAIEGRLLAFGHLLCYLAWILLLQRKGNAQFWFLCALSVLQMATASVLTNDLWFPLSAALYMVFALWTLSVFSLDRAISHSAGVERTARSGGGEADDAAGDGSRSRSNVRLESESRWFTTRFVVGVAINGVLSLLLGLAIFLLTPRVWAGHFPFLSEAASQANQPLTGFTEDVRLGDLGEILESPDLVLEVEFFDNSTNEKLDVESTMTELGHEAPLFRGKVLGRYEAGRWSPSVFERPLSESRLPRSHPLLRQEIALYPIGTHVLFTADEAYACRAVERIGIYHELFTNTFTVESTSDSRQQLQGVFRYVAYSPLSGEPIRWSLTSRNFWVLPTDYNQEMKSLPNNLKRLEQLALSIVGSQTDHGLNQQEQAARLVDYLRNAGGFNYSLSAGIDDPKIDPIEDFLFNRKQGHCEYFASALALMLRAVGISSRLISGFKGGELNKTTGRFEVRQLHAHAWVEALIGGEWVTLDATPASREASVANIRTSRSPYERAQRYLRELWTAGLVIDQAQQKRAIYEPLQRLFGDGFDSIRQVGLWQAIAQWFRQLSANPEDWISIPGFVTAFVLLLVLAGLVWLARRLWRLISGWSFGRRRRQRQHRQVVAFYERFRTLVAREGLVRTETATQQEFADQIEHTWQHRTDIDGLADLPRRLTSAFYRVRFGNEPLSTDELATLDASLTQLETWITSQSKVASRESRVESRELRVES